LIELHLRGRAAAGRRGELIAFLAEAIPFYEAPDGIRVRLLCDVTDKTGSLRSSSTPIRRSTTLLEGPPEAVTHRFDTPA